MSQDIQMLQQMCNDPRSWVSERANIALTMIQQFQNGEIAESEYQELMMDLVRADRLDEEADDLETKTMLVTAVYACAQLI